MATYSYNGKVLVKNSRRENYRFACIDKTTYEKLSISSTATGASTELNRIIKRVEQTIENHHRALVALDFERTTFIWKHGRFTERLPVDNYKKYSSEEYAKLSPREYHTRCIEEEKAYLEELKNKYIIVEVEKS